MKKTNKNRLSTFGRNAEKALQKAVSRVLLVHKQKKIPIAVWRNGKVVKIPPNKISV